MRTSIALQLVLLCIFPGGPRDARTGPGLQQAGAAVPLRRIDCAKQPSSNPHNFLTTQQHHTAAPHFPTTITSLLVCWKTNTSIHSVTELRAPSLGTYMQASVVGGPADCPATQPTNLLQQLQNPITSATRPHQSIHESNHWESPTAYSSNSYGDAPGLQHCRNLGSTP